MVITMQNINECQKEFMKDQVQEIEKYKWIMSEKAGYDLGSSACCEWIKTYAEQFRTFWFENHLK